MMGRGFVCMNIVEGFTALMEVAAIHSSSFFSLLIVHCPSGLNCFTTGDVRRQRG
jgi:hypothetical protein